MEDKFYVLWDRDGEKYVRVCTNTLGVVSAGFVESLATCSKFDSWSLANGVANVARDIHLITLDVVQVVKQEAHTGWEKWQGGVTTHSLYYVVEDMVTGLFYAVDTTVFPASIELQTVSCYADATRFLSKSIASKILLAAEERYEKPCKLVPIVRTEVGFVWEIKE